MQSAVSTNKYCYKITTPDTSVFSQYKNTPIKFKLAYETAKHLKGKSIPQAIKYLKTVMDFKNCIPMTRYNRKVGRTRQAQVHGYVKGKWPIKVCKYFIGVFESLIQDAEKKSLDLIDLKLVHLMVNKSPIKYGRRNSAFGRVKPYNTNGCHLEVVAMVDQKLTE
ncbi:60S ribosomal protein L17 [Cucumispora dikerogammari]|nr:60S ribosomal protein L17 [Cucumispora dikerogammari]